MINSGKNDFFFRPKFSIFLIHWPISGSLNDLKNDYTKNLLFNFGVENVVETLGDRLIGGTTLEIKILGQFLLKD